MLALQNNGENNVGEWNRGMSKGRYKGFNPMGELDNYTASTVPGTE
jgi:hypothetical protein